jgi:ferredoxin
VTIESRVDPELCIGSGDCTRLAPAAFQLDEDQGVSVALANGVAGTAFEVLVQAARGCPTQAIDIVRDGEVVYRSNGR